MSKKFISILIILAMVFTAIPFTVSATEPDIVYISVSDDSQYVTDNDGNPMAFYPVTLDELSEVDLETYGLSEYLYDADSDGSYEITALHLYIYIHEEVLGLDWSDVYVSGSAGSIYFAGGLFGFSDENLRYDLNGAYPAVDGWGLTADQIVLSDADFINVAHYTSWAFWGDSATGFHYFTDAEGNLNHTYNVSANEVLELGIVRSYSDWMNGGAAAFESEIGYTVYYGTSYGVPSGSAVTDDSGLVNITFPSGGTWYVWTDGGYGIENPADIVSAPAFATVKVESKAAEPIDVYVTIADKGDVVMANEVVTVIDLDKSGDFNVDEVLFAAHEDAYVKGAEAGYDSEMTAYGLSVTKLWGDDSGYYGYWLNDASCWSLADAVEADDSIVAFVYQNTEVWDSYSKFSQKSYTAMAESAAKITLEKAGYDENWNTVFNAHKGATLKIYDSSFNEISSENYKVTDNGDGTYSVTVKNIGEYTVVAYDNATPIVPALCTLTVTENPYLSMNKSDAEHKAIYEATGAYINALGTPSVGSVGGEWMVIDLTRSGYKCPEGYYENVVEYVNENINDKEQLHRAKSTDNSRVILALTSAGYDVTDVDGHNLLMGLTDMSYVKKQGINGPIWALIAFDSHNYEIPENADAAEQVTRENLIAYILEKQLEDGGWAMSGKVADPDMTGMAIQALAPYYKTNADVKAAVDKAVTCLSEKQYDNGGFGSVDGICSESCAQVIVALTALEINPETDLRFVKNGVSVVDAMCMFAVDGGGFAHIPNSGVNGMATEQAQYALAAYFRFLDGKTSLYDMSDVDIYTKDEKSADAVEAKISAIGTVTADSKTAIEEARAAYDALTDEQKALVENYDALVSAEADFEEIINEDNSECDIKCIFEKILEWIIKIFDFIFYVFKSLFFSA